MSDKPARKRRFRFSLKTMLVVFVLLCVGLGWLAFKMAQAERQRKAVEAIEKAGGWVGYDYEVNEDYSELAKPEPPAPAWLRERLGVDFFADVICVSSLESVEAGDVIVGHLKVLTEIEWLGLSNTQITDAGLEDVGRLRKLEVLLLFRIQVTNLEKLKGMTKLKILNLSDTQITHAGLKNLRGLTTLERLYLYGTDITDSGLENFKGLTRLKWLDLQDTLVTEEGIEELQEALPSCGIYWDFEPTPDNNKNTLDRD